MTQTPKPSNIDVDAIMRAAATVAKPFLDAAARTVSGQAGDRRVSMTPAPGPRQSSSTGESGPWVGPTFSFSIPGGTMLASGKRLTTSGQVLRQSKVAAILEDLGLEEDHARVGSAIACCEAPAPAARDGEARTNFALIGDQALADDTWGYSYGGFQIRSLRADKGTGDWRDEDLLPRTRFNCRAARAIWRDAGKRWNDWSTYTSGMYKAYLQDLFPPPPNTYIVLAGDTLSEIADKHLWLDPTVQPSSPDPWTWQDLARVNNLHDPYPIYIAQHLILPTTTAAGVI